VSHKGNSGYKTGLETYGQLFGHEVPLTNGQTLYAVELVSIDTSAQRTRNSVEPNKNALHLKRDFTTSFFPQYEFLGDFHTHPFTEPCREIVKKGYYNFSLADYGHIMGSPKYWIKHGYRVGIVLTIALLGSKSKKECKDIDCSTIEFTLGNYRLFLKGNVAMLDEDEEDIEFADNSDVRIHCPSVVGLAAEYTDFGKGVKKPRLRHVCGKI